MLPTVLSVDADAAVRSSRNEVLRKAGFQVIEAASGTEALKLASEEQPALAVLAMELPELDGLAVCRRLKADPRTASIPVLHISSLGGPLGEPQRGYPESIMSGAEAWLREPVEPAALIAVATALIRTAEAGGEGRGRMSVTIETSERKRAEEALRASEERHRLLAETMLQGVVHQDAGGKIVAMNPAAERILGKTREEFLGSSSVQEERDSIHEDGSPFPGSDHPAMVALRTGQPLRGVVMGWLSPRAAAYRWISIDAVPLFGPGETSASGVYTVFEDITERKRADEERQRLSGQLADRAGELQAILDAAPVAVWIAHDPECQEITGNRMADRFYEAEAGENVSANITAARRFFQGGRELAARDLPMQEAAARGVDVRDSELKVLLPSGRSMYMLGNASPLRDAAGEVRGSVGTFLDITGRKRAEEALLESEAVLRGFFDSPGMMRGFVDLVDGVIVHVSCNRAAAEMYGVDREAIAGKTASGMGASEEVVRAWIALYEESWRTGQPVSMEYARHVEGQKDRWLLATAGYIGTRPSGIPRFAYTILDLTKRKRAEEQLRQSEERYRVLFDTLLEGFCIIEVVFDGDAKPVDYRFLEINPAFERQTGLKNARGRLMRDLAPEHEAHWFEIYGQVALTGQPARFVNEARALNRWYDVSAYRVGDPESRRVAILFNDITEAKRAESALRQSESQLRTLGDNLPEGAIYRYRLDAGGEPHVDFISAGIERLTGVPAAEFMSDGAAVERTIMPEDRARLRAAITLSRERLTRFEVEVRHTHRSTGEVRWSLLRSTPSPCPDGSTVWDGIELDITERKRTEEALRQSEALYRGIGESIDYGVWVCDPEGRNTYASESFLKLVGLTQQQCSSFGWGDVLHPDDAERTLAAWKECVRTEGTWDIEHRFRGVDGAWHPILARGVPVRDERGRIAAWAGINLDISRRKQAEEALRLSESRERARAAELEALMDAAPAAIFVAREVDCLHMSGNRAAYDLLRRRPGKNLSKSAPDDEKPTNFRAMKDGIEIPLHDLPIQKAAATGQPVRKHEMEFVFEDGSSINVLGDAVPTLGEDGRPQGAVGVFFDITELKRAEVRLRDAQKLESLGLLAGGVAHDFNNLLVGVIGNASLAQEMLPPDHEAVELLEGVTKAGEQAAHLTRQMLAYSGKGKFLVEALNLSALIPEMTGLVRPSISKKVSLYLDLAEDLPPIEADRGQVQQVFMNLALNAAEAIGSHDGLISIRTRTQDVDDGYLRLHPEGAALRPGRCVCLEVRDTGCGMDEATKAKIFDPFFTTKFTGRGLGLAAVAGILRGHKGAILVDSAPGKGSCFTVLFPAVERAAGEAPLVTRKAALHGAGVLLVVDDEQVVRELAKRALERHGYNVLLAESGQAAIDLCKRHPGDIALIILDLGMPNMGGEEVLPELRKIRPSVKVLVSSGYSEAEAMALFKGQRVSDFIQKPYTSKDLAEKVKGCLG
jgi:PAS domain S-box-containing protein